MKWSELMSIVIWRRNLINKRYIRSSKLLDDFKSEVLSSDIDNALPIVYTLLFSIENQKLISLEVDKLLEKLRTTVSSSDPLFTDLAVLQSVTATALWKYEIDISSNLEDFAREFDRVDDNIVRLHLMEKYRN